MIVIAVCLVLAAQDADVQDKRPLSLRERILAKYDTDKDGRLNVREREVLRKGGEFRSVKEKFRRGKRQKFGPAMMKQFDKDQDGKLNDREYQAAERGLRAKWDELVSKYQAFRDDRVVIENLNKLESAAKAGEIKDFPDALYGWIKFVRDRDNRRGKQGPAHLLAGFDKDNNGRLSAVELKEARAAIALAAIAKSSDGGNADGGNADDGESDDGNSDGKPAEPQKPNAPSDSRDKSQQELR